MSIVTQVKLRDGTYVSAMECVRNGDWPTIERAFTELYEELQAARHTSNEEIVSGQEESASDAVEAAALRALDKATQDGHSYDIESYCAGYVDRHYAAAIKEK